MAWRNRGYGALKSRVDHRDYPAPLNLFNIRKPSDMPARSFVSGRIGFIKNQRSQGSCTGHGGTSEGERLFLRWGAPIGVSEAATTAIQVALAGKNLRFSPAFLYYNERKLEGTLDQGDCGAQVVSSLICSDLNAGAGGSGYCPEDQMPYNDQDYSTAPSAVAYQAALNFPGGAYHSIGNNILMIKNCILSDYTGVIGIAVYDSFEDERTASSGLIPYPNVNVEQIQGGHEMHSLIGYDDTILCPGAKNPGAVATQNSWGTEWGVALPDGAPMNQNGEHEPGFGWLPYDYLADALLTSDVRMSHLGKAW